MEYKKSYVSNYIKVYSWQIVSIILSFVSLFIVMPFLSSNQTLLGIYNLCSSITIFLSYADFGFMGAGQKYASEEVALDNSENILRIILCTKNILTIFVTILIIIFFYLSFNPSLIVTGLNSDTEIIAKKMFFIVAVFSLSTIFERTAQLMYSIHIEDFYYQRFSIIGSLIKVLMAFVFLGNGNYNIIGYFLSIKVITLAVSIMAYFFACRRYNYSRILVFNFSFDKEIFNKMLKLATANFISSISWILYFELDSFFIGKKYGADRVAIYTVAFSLMSFLRTFVTTMFSPYLTRFNHFIGRHEIDNVKKLYLLITKYTSSILIIGITGIIILMKALIYCWVGENYDNSVSIAILLVMCQMLTFITIPSNYIMIAKEKVRLINVFNFIQPLIYWGTIFVLERYLEINVFAVSKFLVFFVSAIIYIIVVIPELEINLLQFIINTLIKNVPFVLTEYFLITLILPYLSYEKSFKNLVSVILTGIVVILPTLFIRFLFDNNIRSSIKRKIIKR